MSHHRRTFLTSGSALLLAATAARAAPEDEARAALMTFLRAFENCDLPAMEAAFAEDAVSFDRTVLTPAASPDLKLDDYRRAPGMPGGMRRIAQTLPKAAAGPPYQSLLPRDLLVQATAEMAVCTFHLEGPHALARRTVVLVRRGGTWKILHIHASNVRDAV